MCASALPVHGRSVTLAAPTVHRQTTDNHDHCEGDIRKNSKDDSDVGSSHPIRGTGPEAHHSKRTSLTYLYRPPRCTGPCAPSREPKQSRKSPCLRSWTRCWRKRCAAEPKISADKDYGVPLGGALLLNPLLHRELHVPVAGRLPFNALQTCPRV